VLKLTFGTSAFFQRDVLKEKVRTVTAHGVYCMPGGTFQEVAIWQGAFDRYLDRAHELGFNAIEVSDGTIEMERRTRADAIAKAVKAGFRVLSEVGKKDPADAQPMAALAEVVNADLDGGAFMVIMEAREAGKGVGIYDASGLPKEAEIEAFLKGVRDPDRILWEAPLGPQQRYLVLRFGPNVNLGNVVPEDILALEALRCGLRGGGRVLPPERLVDLDEHLLLPLGQLRVGQQGGPDTRVGRAVLQDAGLDIEGFGRDAQPLGDLLQDVRARLAQAALDLAQVGVGHPGRLGQLAH
jgi:phosphosulfolactate synthase